MLMKVTLFNQVCASALNPRCFCCLAIHAFLLRCWTLQQRFTGCPLCFTLHYCRTRFASSCRKLTGEIDLSLPDLILVLGISPIQTEKVWLDIWVKGSIHMTDLFNLYLCSSVFTKTMNVYFIISSGGFVDFLLSRAETAWKKVTTVAQQLGGVSRFFHWQLWCQYMEV